MIKSIIKYIENRWRYLFVYPTFRLFIHNSQVNDIINISSIKKLLIIRNDRIGDMIVTTPILKGLKKAKPDLYLGIVANSKNFEIIKNNPNVDRIYMLPSNWWILWKEIKNIRKEEYDLVFNFVFTRMTVGGILANLIVPRGIKIGQGDQRYKFYYNRLLSLQRHSKPMVDVLMNFVKEAIGIDISSLNYDYEIHTDEIARTNVLSFLKKNQLVQRQWQIIKGLPYIVFNLSVNDTARQLSHEQVLAIGEYLSTHTEFRTIIIKAPNDSSILSAKNKLIENTQCIAYPEHGVASLLEISVIIEGAMAVITPDTSFIHFASAAKTPVFGLYATLLHEWLPYKVMNKIIVANKEHFVSKLPVQDMVDALHKFLSNLPISDIIKQ